MNTRLLPTLLTVASLLLTGCLPQSENPLSTPATSRIDTQLEGIYVQRGEGSPGELVGWHFHYPSTKDAGPHEMHVTPCLEVISLDHAMDGPLKSTAYHALTTHLGGKDYISFGELGSDDGKKKVAHYSFARYEISWTGEVRVWLMNNNAFAEAVETGKLHGTIKRHRYDANGTDVLLTDSTQRLAAFIAAGDPAKLFGGKPITLHRVAQYGQ